MTVLGIFAGGHGKRLMPLTADIPKSLIKVTPDKNTLDLIFDSIGGCGVTDAYLLLGAHSEKVIDRYGDKEKGIRIHYLVEESPMGTLYAFRSFCEKSKGDAILMNGDVVSEINMADLLSFSRSSPFMMDMVVKRMRSPFGVVNVTDGRVVSFEEKPLLPILMNAGIYYLKGPFRVYATFNYTGKNVEETVFVKMAMEGKMGAYRFEGFHSSLDGLKDLEEIRLHLERRGK